MVRMKRVAYALAREGGPDEQDFAAMREGEIGRALPKAVDLGAEVLPG